MAPPARAARRDPPPGWIRPDVPLAPRTTLELGGPARWLGAADEPRRLEEAVRWARRRRLPVAVLAGGSNLVIADRGFDGLVLTPDRRGVTVEGAGDGVRLAAGAAEPWDGVVARAVGEGLAGIECLSGIPGTAGATPIQNVGAYGQEVSEVTEGVRVLDLESFAQAELPASECGFGYRTSLFRCRPTRYLVLEVVMRLRPGGAPSLRYPELERRVRELHVAAGLADVRQQVLAVRRSKSMVLDDPQDPNRRSVGSFFVNPTVVPVELARVERLAVAGGASERPGAVPRFALGDGRFKLSAAWLIEASGYAKGHRRGAVGLSSRHALALVHHGGGRTADLVALASEIREAVRARFGITLEPEPTFLGFPPGDPLG